MKFIKNLLVFLSKVAVIGLTFLYVLLYVGGAIANDNTDTISNALDQNKTNLITIDSDDVDEDEIDTEYYKSVYKNVLEVKAAGVEFTRTIMEEGAVLLKNDNNALPLKDDGLNVSLFSVSSAKPVYSGYRETYEKASSSNVVDLKTGLEKTGKITVNNTLYKWYANSSYGRKNLNSGSGLYEINTVNEAPWSALPDAKTASGYRTAIFVISRIGGEGTDNQIKAVGTEGFGSDLTEDNYLRLTPNEKDVLDNLKANKGADKAFDRIVVLMNTTNQVQIDFEDDVDAILWCGGLGSAGSEAIGKILTGEVNPSGKLNDTFWKNHYLNPVHANWGQMSYKQGGGIQVYTGITYDESGKYDDGYSVYQEGIYVGYRYTETRYEDVVLGRKNVGDYTYTDAVSYPFGYGLSYTDFTYTMEDPVYDAEADEYTVKVKVTNTGSVAGKNAVQLFLQKPYIEGGTEKAAVELVNYAKTDVLEPNESCEVTLRVDKREFASYDAYNAKTYVLDGGDYYLTVAADAHTALNNILLNKSQANTEKMISIGKDESSQSLAKKITLDTDTKTYSVSETGVEITNQFDNADLTSDYWSGDANYKSFKYISRNDWAGTTNYFTVSGGSISPAVKLTRTSKITTESDRTYGIEEDNGTYPTMGSTKTSYQLIDLRVDENGEPRAYDDPMWDDLLDQLTWDDMYNLLSYGFASTRAVTSITKPATYDYDSDLGVIQSYGGQSAGLAAQNNDPDKDEKPACYLDNSIVAATRNLKLLREYGEQWGEDCLWAGYNGLYGTGANIHRSPYGGRNYGYFSEDPYLAGASIAQMNLGMKSKGVFMLLKHCMLNEQETNRCGASSWANEQSIREIYLKVFQIAIEDGEVQGVMTSLNRIGATAAPHHNFLNTVLRGEFGMRGYNVTDSYMGYMHIGSCVLAGNDLPLAQDSDLKNYQTGYSKIAWAMRDSVHNILYTTVHSRAMNGISSNMRVVSFQPEWQYYLEYYTPIVKKFAIISILLYFSMELFVDNPLLFERRKKPKVQ